MPSLFYAPWKSHSPHACAVNPVISLRHLKAGEHCLRHQLQSAEAGLAAGRGSLVLLLCCHCLWFYVSANVLCSHIANEIREPVWVEAFWGWGGFGWVSSPRWHQGRGGTGPGVSVQRWASLVLSLAGLLNSLLKWL